MRGAVILTLVRELLYQAAEHFRRGKALTDQGDLRGAIAAYGDALHDLHAVKPQRMRDVLLAQVYLSRYQLEKEVHDNIAMNDLRLGYSYARTAREPSVQELAEKLWQEHTL
jgi:hypothetical protein